MKIKDLKKKKAYVFSFAKKFTSRGKRLLWSQTLVGGWEGVGELPTRGMMGMVARVLGRAEGACQSCPL